MNCSVCKTGKTVVVDSRQSNDNQTTRRRRRCVVCGERATTLERYVSREVVVVSASMSESVLSRKRLMDDIRPILESSDDKSVGSFVDAVIASVREIHEIRVSSKFIRTAVLDRLRGIPKIKYLSSFCDLTSSVYIEMLKAETLRLGQ